MTPPYRLGTDPSTDSLPPNPSTDSYVRTYRQTDRERDQVERDGFPLSNAREQNPIRSEDRGELPDEEPIGTTLNRICVGCGTEYEWTSREGWQWPTSYCTRKCKRKCSPKRRTKLAATDEASSVGMVLLICGRCENPFGWTPRAEATGDLTPPTYCSQGCADRAYDKRKKDRQLARKNSANENRQRREDAERTAAVMAQSDAARFLMLPAGRCTICGKVASLTEDAAKETKRAIEQRAGRTNEVRYYQCPDGWWHWTRMDATLDGFRARQAELLMTESPASLRHRGRGSWAHLGETR